MTLPAAVLPSRRSLPLVSLVIVAGQTQSLSHPTIRPLSQNSNILFESQHNLIQTSRPSFQNRTPTTFTPFYFDSVGIQDRPAYGSQYISDSREHLAKGDAVTEIRRTIQYPVPHPLGRVQFHSVPFEVTRKALWVFPHPYARKRLARY